MREAATSVNSLTIADDMVIAGQSGGYVSIFKIGANLGEFEKIKDFWLIDKNISKIILTSRKDFALGTESGVVFCCLKSGNNLVLTSERYCLKGKDITELSEYDTDKFAVGQWSENDFLLFDRNQVDIIKVIKMPLWCNALCTDLIAMPQYHPVTFPFYLSKTMRSLNLIDFK